MISKCVTRSSESQPNLLYIPYYPTTRLQRCIKFQGVKIWNNIPLDIQNKSSEKFKSQFKKFLLTCY